ncbi:MAG: hypothetical protein KDA42_01810 [Planctomycetales bacterium]|nr:hypothetical protein [Planctomycetales bacterium]
MRLIRRSVGIVLTIVVAVLAVAAFSAYRASQHVPEFYTEALELDVEQFSQVSQELESRVTMLYSDARKDEKWYAHFTDRQINAWLAVNLLEQYGDWISEDAHDPRVKIAPDGITLAVRVDEGALQVVYSFEMDLYLNEPNELAFRLRKARAGKLPIPLATVVAEVSATAEDMEYPLSWKQVEGDPVALAPIHPQFDEDNNELRIDKIELREGAIYLTGTTVAGEGMSEPPSSGGLLSQNAEEVAFQLRDHIKRQR